MAGQVATSTDFTSSFYNPKPSTQHRREQSMNSTVDPEIKRTRMQAQAERRVESCERPPKCLVIDGGQEEEEYDDDYSILQSKNARNPAVEDEISLFLKTAVSPDVQTLKRRLIEHQNNSRQRGAKGTTYHGNFMNMTQPESSIKQNLKSEPESNKDSITITNNPNRLSEVRKSAPGGGVANH